MPFFVQMPTLGESVTDATVTRWLKQVGDHVDVDEPLLEVSTDKVDTEIPSPVGGTLLEISAGEDETVQVGGQLALIGDASVGGGSAPQMVPEEPRQEEHAQEQSKWDPHPRPDSEPEAASQYHKEVASMATATSGSDYPSAGDIPYVTPLVRKLAAEHQAELNSVQGAGVSRRIRMREVLATTDKNESKSAMAEPIALSAPSAGRSQAAVPTVNEPSIDEAVKLRGTRQKMSRLRSVIAQRMVESLRVSAQLTAMLEVDVTRIAQLRELVKGNFERREGVKLSFLPFFVQAAVESLKLFPQLNASLDLEKKEIVYHDAEHVGIAVDTDRGLVVPVLYNAGDLNLPALARGIADLAERTRTNKIKPDELSGGTFTVTNIGSRGSLADTPIINQPQVAILGTGAVVKRPLVVTDDLGQDTLAIRSIAALVLTYDHRLVDGADAARFLSAVKRRMETSAFEADLAPY
jgi:pyruvate dehydrogenase E2 component (dihydrolipoamide acetyltransferase)